MLAAVNSKKGKYEPMKYMANGKALAERAREEQAEREPISGDEIIAQLRRAGVQIIDKRAKRSEAIQ
jgi:hypothetical protein